MLCFNIPRPIPTEVADTYFFQAQCLCWFSVFIFRPGHSTTKSQACFLSVSVLIWGGEPTGLQAKYCLWQNVVIENGLLTLCSRFAHALLTLCSRSLRFLLSPYEQLPTLCLRFAHVAHALGEVSILMRKPHHATPHFFVPNHVYPKAHSFQAADSLRQNLKFALSA